MRRLVIVLALTIGLFLSGCDLSLIGNINPPVTGGGATTQNQNVQENKVEVASPSASTINGKVLFVKDGNIWIWTGTAYKQLTSSKSDTHPDWYPQGDKFVFVRKGNSFSDLYIMDYPSGNLTQLTKNKSKFPENSKDYVDNSYWAFRPVWSPLGDQIAFAFERNTYDMALWTIGANGSGAKQISKFDDYSGGIDKVDWSPDGKKIVVTRFSGGAMNLWVLDLAKGQWQQLTKTEEGAYDPVWSPDGAYIAYTARTKSKNDIWVIPAEGGSSIQVTQTGSVRSPSWSPVDNQIAFLKDQDGSFDLWVMDYTANPNFTVSNQRQLTKSSYLDATSGLSWSK